MCHISHKDKQIFGSEKRQVSNGAKSFKGYFLCRSNWLIVIEAWSSLIENVHFYQSLIATLIWKGHTWTYSLFYKCHDLIHFFWHFLCHKEGIFSVPFSSNFKLVFAANNLYQCYQKLDFFGYVWNLLIWAEKIAERIH